MVVSALVGVSILTAEQLRVDDHRTGYRFDNCEGIVYTEVVKITIYSTVPLPKTFGNADIVTRRTFLILTEDDLFLKAVRVNLSVVQPDLTMFPSSSMRGRPGSTSPTRLSVSPWLFPLAPGSDPFRRPSGTLGGALFLNDGIDAVTVKY